MNTIYPAMTATGSGQPLTDAELRHLIENPDRAPDEIDSTDDDARRAAKARLRYVARHRATYRNDACVLGCSGAFIDWDTASAELVAAEIQALGCAVTAWPSPSRWAGAAFKTRAMISYSREVTADEHRHIYRRWILARCPSADRSMSAPCIGFYAPAVSDANRSQWSVTDWGTGVVDVDAVLAELGPAPERKPVSETERTPADPSTPAQRLAWFRETIRDVKPVHRAQCTSGTGGGTAQEWIRRVAFRGIEHGLDTPTLLAELRLHAAFTDWTADELEDGLDRVLKYSDTVEWEVALPMRRMAALAEQVQSARAPVRAAAGFTLTRLDAVKVEQVDWLWERRIARGAITMIMGEGGVSKSTASLDIAARVSTGARMPGELHGRAPGDVVLLSLEDAPAFVLKPRLLAAGADCARVHLLESVTIGGVEHPFSFDRDLHVLESVLDETSAQLLIVDPIGAFLGAETESHNYASVRGVLDPLAKLASDRHIAVLCIAHTNKGSGSAMHRANGSSAFVQLVRSALAIGPDPNDENDPPRLALAAFKANLGPKAPTLTYTLVDTPVEGASNVARIQWGPTCDLTADDVLRLDRPAPAKAVKGAIAELLADGPKDADECMAELVGRGFSRRTIERHSAELVTKLPARSEGGKVRRWTWALKPAATPPTRSPSP